MKILTNHIPYETHAAKQAGILGQVDDRLFSFKRVDSCNGSVVLSGAPTATSSCASRPKLSAWLPWLPHATWFLLAVSAGEV